MSKIVTPWGPIGYITYKRTYSRRLKENDPNSATEEFNQTVERVIKACRTQLKVGFTEVEEKRLEEIFLSLKGSVAGRFWWQLGTKTVDKLGLLSLQNCAGTVVDSLRAFTWTMDALMLGSGVGYNIQREYVYQLPKVKKVKIVRQDTNDADFIVPDSREGWVNLLDKVLKAHFKTGKGFTYSTICIRGKGAPIKGFGGTAAGPEELCWGMEQISNVLNARAGKKIRSIDALDIMNIIGFVVVAGNVRRSAQLAVGDMDDLQFLNAKNWGEGSIPNWRAMSNNSVACNDIKLLPDQFWNGYNGTGEAYGLINIKLSQDIGRLGETDYSDKNVIVFNPCVTGDTEILTDDGYKRIDSVVDQETNIWNGFEWSKVTPKVTGINQDLLTVTFSDGRHLTCTKYHNFHIAVGSRGEIKEIKAQDLESGMKLIKHHFPVIEHGEEIEDNYAYTQGFISAEGMDGYKFLWAYGPKKMCLPTILGNIDCKSEKRLTVNLQHKFNPKFIPFKWNLKAKLNWLAGLFDGDGCELKEGGLQLVSVDHSFLSELQKILSTVGVQSKITSGNTAGMRKMPDGHGGLKDYYCQESKRILIGAVQMQNLKKLGLKCERMAFDKSQKDASQFVTVVDVTESGEAEMVYCFNEPKKHLGIFNGVVTGQCGEQSLAAYETCCLAEIFLPNITSKEEFFEVQKYLYRINKHSLALPCHAEETEEIVHKHMRMGIGVTGYLQASEEQKSWLNDAYLELRKFDKEYSQEHGWPESIKLTTCKPSGTLSLLPNVTPGVHPAYSRYYLRRIRIASNNPLVETCRQNGYDIEYQKNFDGTDDKNTVIVSFPVSVPEGTVTAKDLTAIQQMEYVKRLQTEWSDNSVSCTVYYRSEELPEIKKWLKKNYNKEVKTMSFLLHKDHGFAQAPYEEITKEQFEEYSSKVKPITSGDVNDDQLESMECVSGVCPIK